MFRWLGIEFNLYFGCIQIAHLVKNRAKDLAAHSRTYNYNGVITAQVQ